MYVYMYVYLLFVIVIRARFAVAALQIRFAPKIRSMGLQNTYVQKWVAAIWCRERVGSAFCGRLVCAERQALLC